MTVKTLACALSAAVLATVLTGTGTGSATAAPYTAQVRGDGSSSFGFAWEYARRDARDKAVADGFADPAAQCEEIFSFGNPFDAMVIWECTR
jgi:hypothetical protein